MKKISALVLAVILFFCAGCTKGDTSYASASPALPPTASQRAQEPAVPQSEETAAEEKALAPEAYLIASENYFDYQSGMECAAYSSAYLLRHYGSEADGLKLFETFPQKAPDGGIMPYGIEAFFEKRGYDAEFNHDGTIEALKAEIHKGAPVIVFIHVRVPYTSTHDTHYVPLVGYDSEYFYFAESLAEFANCKDETGLSYNRKTKITDFEQLWKNIDGTWDNPYFSIAKPAPQSQSAL